MKKQRIYLVGHGQEIRLVRAAHQQQALGHVARSIINVKIAGQEELIEAVSRGVSVENAREEDTPELFADEAA
jgi:hypothetical protein